MARAKNTLVGKTFKEEGNSYIFVEAESPRGGYDICEYLAEAGGNVGTRVYAIGEHSEAVAAGYLESLAPAEREVAVEVAYRNAYRTKYYETWHILWKTNPKGDAGAHANAAAAAAQEATAALRALVYQTA